MEIRCLREISEVPAGFVENVKILVIIHKYNMYSTYITMTNILYIHTHIFKGLRLSTSSGPERYTVRFRMIE